MRRQKGTWRQLRHKDDERRLIEKKKKLQDKAKDHPNQLMLIATEKKAIL